MIISASKRCDIPSYFGQWFINRLREGYVLIQNPYNPNRVSRASLTREAVDIIVFWTKNPIPFLKYLDEIDTMGYPYYFQFTLTPYGKETEKNLPDKERLIEVFLNLSARLGKNRIIWRYDPIIIDDVYTIEYHRERFTYMAERLRGSTNRCIISFVDNYKSVSRRMGKDITANMVPSNVYAISKIFSEIARDNNIKIYTCAEGHNLQEYNINHGACIDKEIIESILGTKVQTIIDKNQRSQCLCVESIDIGGYNSCNNGCNYCYALTSEETARENIKSHDPNSPILIGSIEDGVIISNRDNKSIVIDQLSLF